MVVPVWEHGRHGPEGGETPVLPGTVTARDSVLGVAGILVGMRNRRRGEAIAMPPNLLSNLAEARALLSRRPSGLITDVDGTISPIAREPGAATVRADARRWLELLAGRLELVAALSGRSVADLVRMVDVPGVVCVGNHGLEWWENGRTTVAPEAEPYLPVVAAAVRELSDRLQDLSGALVENKGASATVHYRLSPDPDAARDAILKAIAGSPSAQRLRVADGRMVVNLLPPVRVDKGTAVERLVLLRKLLAVVYLGDDVTDLDAFRAVRSLRESGRVQGVAVAVASAESPVDLLAEADYMLEDVDAVVCLLREMVSGEADLTGGRELS